MTLRINDLVVTNLVHYLKTQKELLKESVMTNISDNQLNFIRGNYSAYSEILAKINELTENAREKINKDE